MSGHQSTRWRWVAAAAGLAVLGVLGLLGALYGFGALALGAAGCAGAMVYLAAAQFHLAALESAQAARTRNEMGAAPLRVEAWRENAIRNPRTP